MITKKCFMMTLVALGITFSTQTTQAVSHSSVGNDDVSLFATAWPLVMIVAIIFLLRKHFIPQESVTPQVKAKKETQIQTPTAQPVTPVTHSPIDSQTKASYNPAQPTKPTQPVQPTKPAPVVAQKKPITQAKTPMASGNIDLKDSGQCQAITTKGDRCKRKTNLENASVSANGKTYDITACKQHNNKSLQIFAKLLP